MAKRSTKRTREIGNMVEEAFLKYGRNIQFNIFDLGKINKAGYDAGLANQSIDEAVKAAIELYRIKEAA